MKSTSLGVLGFHHVTGIAGPAQRNWDFYTGMLGLRLVKRSVNQDAPGVYHLFYADARGTPGSDITFFPWPSVAPAIAGVGTITKQGFFIPEGSLTYWQERLTPLAPMLEEDPWLGTVLSFQDPDGLKLVLVPSRAQQGAFAAWEKSPIPPFYQIRGLAYAEIVVGQLDPTRLVLELLGFEALGADGARHRFVVGQPDQPGYGYLDVRVLPALESGRWGRGGMHHLAWRVRDEAHLRALADELRITGLSPTDVIDRFWFRSVYFREPGGVLFELAIDRPGFGVDEDPDHLGEALVLPPWLEPHRLRIQAALPPLAYLSYL